MQNPSVPQSSLSLIWFDRASQSRNPINMQPLEGSSLDALELGFSTKGFAFTRAFYPVSKPHKLQPFVVHQINDELYDYVVIEHQGALKIS